MTTRRHMSHVTYARSDLESLQCVPKLKILSIHTKYKLYNITSTTMSLFRNKRFLHDEMTKWNASKFPIFLEYKSFFFVLSPPCSISLGHFKHDPLISEK